MDTLDVRLSLHPSWLQSVLNMNPVQYYRSSGSCYPPADDGNPFRSTADEDSEEDAYEDGKSSLPCAGGGRACKLEDPHLHFLHTADM